MQNPNPLLELQSLDHPIRIAAVLDRHLKYAGVETLQGLGDVGLAAFGRDRQRPHDRVLRPSGKAIENLLDYGI